MAMALLFFCRLLLGLGAQVLEVSHTSRHIQHQLGQEGQCNKELGFSHAHWKAVIKKDKRTQHMTMHVTMAARMFNLSLVVPLKLSPLHVLASLVTERNTQQTIVPQVCSSYHPTHLFPSPF
jgi:hypothetical protein